MRYNMPDVCFISSINTIRVVGAVTTWDVKYKGLFAASKLKQK